MKHEDYSLVWLLACSKTTVGSQHFRAGRFVENYFYTLLTNPEDVHPLADFDMEVFLKQCLGEEPTRAHRDAAAIVFDHIVEHCIEQGIALPVQ